MGQNYWESDNNKKPYWENNTVNVAQVGAEASGLQQFMIQTFTWMALGLTLTGVTAIFTVSSETLLSWVLYNKFVFFGLIIAEFAMVIAFGMALKKGAQASKLMAMFLAYSALNGLTLSVILLVYTYQSVASTFFIAAGMFGGISLYG